MDLQETIVLRIKRERERERGSHLATNYILVGLQRTTHASSERHQWGWWTPLWWCLDWIWWFWNLQQLELIFVDSPRFLECWGIYRAKRQCGRPPRWAQPTWTRLGPQALPGGLCSPRSSPLVLSSPNRCLLVQKKSTKKFCCIWTPFDIDFLRCKKQAKNSNWHWALCL